MNDCKHECGTHFKSSVFITQQIVASVGCERKEIKLKNHNDWLKLLCSVKYHISSSLH